MAQRLQALRALATAGYPVGLTIAPIMPVLGWQQQYLELLQAVALCDPQHRCAGFNS